MTYRHPRSACAGFVDGSLIAFKRYVDVYWDLVPTPTTFYGHSLLTGSLYLMFDHADKRIVLLEGPQDSGTYWAILTVLKKHAFFPQKYMCEQPVTNGRAMTKAEFWEVLRKRLISLAFCDKNIWTPRT